MSCSPTDRDLVLAIAQRVKALRGALSQMRFAAQLGVNVKTITRWELGTSTPDGASLLALARHFGCSVSWLLTGEESLPAQSSRISAAQASGLPPAARRHLVNYLLEMAAQLGDEQLHLLLRVAELAAANQATSPEAGATGTTPNPHP